MNAAYLTPAITLFNEDGSLDLVSQERLFNNLIDQGIDGILVEGSSSEFFAMPMDQRREMAKFAIEKINHRVKLIIGTSHMVADEIVSFSNFCLDAGADAVMILPPYYFHFGAAACSTMTGWPSRSTATSTSTTSRTTPATPSRRRPCWPWPKSTPTSWA